jgi:hypothetical protein
MFLASVFFSGELFLKKIGPACPTFIGRHYVGTCKTRGSNPRQLATSIGGFATAKFTSPMNFYVALLNARALIKGLITNLLNES